MLFSVLPFFYFLIVASLTPGPNNVMLTASGMNFGFKKTIPHILGIITGFSTLMALCALGVGAVYDAYPAFEKILKVFGAGYLLYLSYKILMAGRIGLDETAKKTVRPLKFIESYAFQFVNPKSVVFGLSALTLLPLDMSFVARLLVVVLCSAFCAMVSASLWATLGKTIAKLFRQEKIRWVINIILACLLLATLPMILL